jgi:hypothetical protein
MKKISYFLLRGICTWRHTHCQMILWLERPKDWRLSEVQVEVLDGFNFSKGRGDGLTRYWRLCGMSIGLV